MADQGRWFKLWCSAASDPDLSNLTLEDFGRWCLLGIYIKQHGTDGVLVIRSPGTSLRTSLRVGSYWQLVDVLERLPNCTVTRGNRSDDKTSSPTTDFVKVMWRNWRKYQHDSSAERTSKWRSRKRRSVTTDETPIEEMRREENIPCVSPPPENGSGQPPGTGFAEFYALYPRKAKPRAAEKAWKSALKRSSPAAIMAGLWRQMPELQGYKPTYRPYPATWLNGDSWLSESTEKPNDNPYAGWPTLYDCGGCERGCHETLDQRDECRAQSNLPAMPR